MFFQYVWLTVFYYDNEQAALSRLYLTQARSRDYFFFLIKVETTYNSLLLHLWSYKSKTLFKTIQNIYFICVHSQ